MIMHDMKESHIGNKDDLVWDQYRHSKSFFGFLHQVEQINSFYSI